MPTEPDRTFRVRSLVLALLAAASTCATSLLVGGLLRSGSSPGSWGLLAFAIYFLGALVVAVLVGIPARLVLRARGLDQWWSLLLVGMAIGTAIGWLEPVGNPAVAAVWPWIIAGALASQASWWVWRWSEHADADLGPLDGAPDHPR